MTSESRNKVAVVDRSKIAAHDADRATAQCARGWHGRGRGCGRPRRGLSGAGRASL